MNMLNMGMMATPGQGGGPPGVGGPPVQGRGDGGPGLAQFMPPGMRGPGQPPSVFARLPPGAEGRALFRPGSVLHGRVEGQQGKNYFLRLGEHMLKAQSKVPLRVGQTVNFKVQGQNMGQLHLQLVKTPFTKMSTADVSLTLANLKVPNNEGNVALAKTMLEHNIPLTKENFSTIRTMLAQTANAEAGGRVPNTPSRVAATHFLQSSQLSVSPQNVTVLANFMATNPQIGVQMFSLNHEFRRLSRSTSGDSRAVELLSSVPGALGELVLEPKRKNAAKKNSKKLFDAARQMGIETHFGSTFGSGDDDWDLLALMREMRQNIEAQTDDDGVHRFLAMMKDLEENLQAHKLINQARPESASGYYYLQVPMRLDDGECAEIWVRYHHEHDGEKVVDAEDTRIEFLINTEHLGELAFTLELQGGLIHLDLGTPSEEVREFASRYLPALAERLGNQGWVLGRVDATYRPFTGKRKLVERTDFDDLERCNVEA